MKRINFNILLIVLLIFVGACSTSKGTKAKLTGIWYFKSSEGSGKIENWVSDRDAVERRRGVRTMEFKPNGVFVGKRSGKADKTVTSQGMWKFNGDRTSIVIETSRKGKVKKEMVRIIMCTKEKLKLKR